MVNPARDTTAGRVYNDLRNLARRNSRSTDDSTPQVMPSTGGHSHAGPGGQRSCCRTTKNTTVAQSVVFGCPVPA